MKSSRWRASRARGCGSPWRRRGCFTTSTDVAKRSSDLRSTSGFTVTVSFWITRAPCGSASATEGSCGAMPGNGRSSTRRMACRTASSTVSRKGLRERSGRVRTRRACYVFRDGRFHAVPTGEPSIRSVCMGRDGVVWAGLQSEGLCRIAPRLLTTVQVGGEKQGRRVNGLVEDPVGELWVGSLGGGLHHGPLDRLEAVPDTEVLAGTSLLYDGSEDERWNSLFRGRRAAVAPGGGYGRTAAGGPFWKLHRALRSRGMARC